MSEIPDIVDRLREKRGILDNRWPGPSEMDIEAAEMIERLRVRIGQLSDIIVFKDEEIQALRRLAEEQAEKLHVAEVNGRALFGESRF